MMQFSLRTLFLVVLVAAASMAAFGFLGFAIALIVVALAAYIGWAQRKSVGAMPVAFVVLIGLGLVILLWAADSSSCRRQRRYRCLNHTRQIAFALWQYHDVHGRFPPAYLCDADGKPTHSWRVLILPYMEERSLYDQYDFNEPWNGPNNRKLADQMPRDYDCPSNTQGAPITSYVAVVGPQTTWPAEQAIKRGDVSDGADQTIMVVEVRDSGIQWMEPRDLSFEEACRGVNPPSGAGISSAHETHQRFYRESLGANAAFANGSVCFLPEDLSPETLKALLTKDSGETVDIDTVVDPNGPGSRRLNWRTSAALLVFAAATMLLFRRAWQSTEVQNNRGRGLPGPVQ